MEVRKTIVSEPHKNIDYAQRKAYYEEAKICPCCKKPSRSVTMVINRHLGYQYRCKDCGCVWEVDMV